MLDIEKEMIDNYTENYGKICNDKGLIDKSLFDLYDVKRGLRDINGKGVLAGITKVSLIKGFEEQDGNRVPCEGKLYYRGYDINDLVKGFTTHNRFGFEEIIYLLLFSALPNKEQLAEFTEILGASRDLPKNFVRDVIMKAPSKDIMNSMTKSILTLASYDDRIDDLSTDNVLRQCLNLITIFPRLAVYGFHAYNHYELNDSLYIHRPDNSLSMAENILRMLRPDTGYTELEARILDAALVLHMEHGGGNNSTFTTRVISSAGSDTYSAIAAAILSLKGPKHGGASNKVPDMMQDIKDNVADITDEEEVRRYLSKILDKDAFDRRGLIYGMGHAVYTLSDPRALIFKGFVEQLAEAKGRKADFDLYSLIARLAPEVIGTKRRIYKGVCFNIDFYSGFVYSMLDIPMQLYTPMFAMARIVGWSAHRLEELINADKIIRPAYKSIGALNEYLDIDQR